VSPEQFEYWSLAILVPGLILYMCYIMYKLCKDSNAGKFGTMIVFLVLGLGVMGFVIKEVLIHTLDV
jgi:hypothetical protein